ncbi:MAG: hypothetical protein R3F19_26405 [Verrucomicrobiales bacterium]|nr:hypothetical protein [Verrucomicrobiae bacterium]
MEVLALTVLGSLVLAALFVVLFLSNGRTSAPEQDSLLPLADGKAPSVTPLPPMPDRPEESDTTPTKHEK